jgi:hypothetical protein
MRRVRVFRPRITRCASWDDITAPVNTFAINGIPEFGEFECFKVLKISGKSAR